MSADYLAAVNALRGARCAVAVTGAGISAESGIPTFRGAGGIWEKYPPEEYATIDAYRYNPDKVWKFWCDLAALVRGCSPNPGHIALAALERAGILRAVITQNVDNLHQAAGSKTVVEYHGNARRLVCMKCRALAKLDPVRLPPSAPRCTHCGAVMKPDVVMFGEDIPAHARFEAHALAEKCDVMIVVGTSAQVYPAAELPFTAKSNGAFVIETNTEPTDFTRAVSDVFLEGPAGSVLPRLVERVTAA